MTQRSRPIPVLREGTAGSERVRDPVAVEDPLEIRLEDRPFAVVMRTPGDDEDLVYGFLLTEGILLGPDEVHQIKRLDESRVSVTFREGVEVDPTRFHRNLFMSSSCGVCGKASIEAVQLFARPAPHFTVQRSVVAGLTAQLRVHQPTFDATGGLHAAGVFSLDGTPVTIREDVGRHNAVDKAIGAAARRSWPLQPTLLVVSGRQSFEIVQKAAVVGMAGVVGVSAPSTLAVELALHLGALLVGFSRSGKFNVYAGEEHLVDG